jgi:hypothetical protein
MVSIEAYADKERELLEELLTKDTESIKTKKALVERLVEVTRELFKLGYIEGLKKQDISSYVNGRLTEYGITYPRNQKWWSIFQDDEKRSYEGTTLNYTRGINHEHKFESGKCECGSIISNSIIYEEEKVDDTPIKITAAEPETSSSKLKATAVATKVNTDLSDYLKRVYQNAMELSIIARDIENKYQTNPGLQKVMDKALTEIPKKIEEQKTVQALLIHANKNADFRQKIGEFEKVKALMLEKSIYNTAKVAKLLSVTPKHMTNNIMTSYDEYMRNLKWFKLIHIVMPQDIKKGETFQFNIADWYNMNLERMTIGLHQTQVKLL